jgi:hypothetical protein
MKTTFKSQYEWSDFSEFSPSHRGQLPSAVILPSGKLIDLSGESIFVAAADFAGRHPGSRAEYTPLTRDGVVRARLTTWGDDGRSSSTGRNGFTLEVIAPKGSQFRFLRYCEYCNEIVGEAATAARGNDDRCGDPHPACKAEWDAQRKLMES